MKNNKKIAILNLQHSNNYGAVLQAFALQEAIKGMGFEVEIINFNPCFSTLDKLRIAFLNIFINKDFLKSIIYHLKLILKIKSKNEIRSSNEKEMKFKIFRNRFLNLGSKISGALKPSDDIYDIYIVGSDSVWGPEKLMFTKSKAYFLGFAKENKVRIAYAASFGKDMESLNRCFSKKYKEHLESFNFISIREMSGVKYLNSFLTQKAVHCMDPTLLHPKKFYNNMLPTNSKYKESFIYLYLLEGTREMAEYANTLSSKLSFGIYHSDYYSKYISNSFGLTNSDGPLDFIEKVKNASLIITNSFHGIIFSIIFQKDFFAFHRKNLNSRITDLLDSLELSNRYIENNIPPDQAISPINYKKVYAKLDALRESSYQYLFNAINTANF